MASGMASTKPTMIGDTELGMRWRQMMCQGEAPSACAAMMNSFSRKDFTWARTSRQTSFQPKSAAIRMMAQTPPRVTRGEQQRREQRRHDREQLDDAHRHPVEAAAEIAGHRAERQADQQAEERGREADAQRHAGAIDDAGEEIAAEVVDAEPVLRRRGRRALW